VLLLILARLVSLSRFERLLDGRDHTIFGGVTYADAHVNAHGDARSLRVPSFCVAAIAAFNALLNHAGNG